MNVDLVSDIVNGYFCEDLFYCFNVIEINVFLFSEWGDDVLVLV